MRKTKIVFYDCFLYVILVKLHPHPLHNCNHTAKILRFTEILWEEDLVKAASFNMKNPWVFSQMSDGQAVLLSLKHLTAGIHLFLLVLVLTD